MKSSIQKGRRATLKAYWCKSVFRNNTFSISLWFNPIQQSQRDSINACICLWWKSHKYPYPTRSFMPSTHGIPMSANCKRQHIQDFAYQSIWILYICIYMAPYIYTHGFRMAIIDFVKSYQICRLNQSGRKYVTIAYTNPSLWALLST